MKGALVLAVVACAYLYVSRADYEDALAHAHVQAQPRAECECAEKDYLGRHLVASYCGRSAQLQTKRCTYAPLWS